MENTVEERENKVAFFIIEGPSEAQNDQSYTKETRDKNLCKKIKKYWPKIPLGGKNWIFLTKSGFFGCPKNGFLWPPKS